MVDVQNLAKTEGNSYVNMADIDNHTKGDKNGCSMESAHSTDMSAAVCAVAQVGDWTKEGVSLNDTQPVLSSSVCTDIGSSIATLSASEDIVSDLDSCQSKISLACMALERRQSRELLRPFILTEDISVDFDEQPLYFDGLLDALPEVPTEAYASIAAELSGLPTTTSHDSDNALRSTIIQRAGGQRFGLSVSSVNRNIHIALVLKGSPAANAGLRVGDRLHEFNGQRLVGQDPLDLLKHMNHTSRKISLLTSSCEFMKTYYIRKKRADDRLGLRLERCKILGTVADTPAHAHNVPSQHYLVYINNICVIGMDILRISNTLALWGRDIKIEIMPEREYILLMVQFGSDSMARKLLDKPLKAVQTTVPDQDTSIFNWNFIETFANNSTTATDFKRSVSHFESSIFHSSSDHNSTPSSPTVSPTHSPVFRRSNPGAIHELHNQSAATGHPSGSRIGTDNTEVKAGGVVRTNTHATIHANAKAYTPSHSSQLLRPQPTIRTAKSVNATPSQHPMFNRLQGDNGNHSRDRIPSEDDGDVLFSNNASKSPADSPRVAGTSERAMKFLGLDDQHDDTYGDGPPPSPLEALTKKFILPLLW